MKARRNLFHVSAMLSALACVSSSHAGVLFDDALNDTTRDAFVVGVDVQGLPYESLKNAPAAAVERGLEIQQTEAGLTLGVPVIEVGANTELRQQARFDSLFLTYQEFSSLYGQEVGNAYEFSYRVQAVMPMGQSWSLNPSVQPGFFNDGEGWSGRNFKVQGGVVANHSFSDSANAGFGFVYSNVFGRPLLLPALTASVRTDRMRYLVDLPYGAEAWYVKDTTTELGLVARAHGNEYGLNKPDTTEGKSLEYTMVEIGPSALFHIGPGLLQLDLGYTLDRRLKVVDGAEQPGADLTPENTWFIRVSGAFRPTSE